MLASNYNSSRQLPQIRSSTAAHLPVVLDHRSLNKNFLRQGIEYHNRLIRPGYHGFRDGNQAVLLAKNAQARRPWFTAIELRGGAWWRLDAARLNGALAPWPGLWREVRVVEVDDVGKTLRVRVGERELTLSHETASKVWAVLARAPKKT